MLVSLALAGCQVRRVQTTQRPHASQRQQPKQQRQEHLSKPRPATSAKTERLIKEARKWIGTPYRYGGTSRSGVDGSGLTMELFREVYDIKLPRSSAAQQEFCIGVSRKDLQPGDLVFFATTKRKNVVSHVGLYIGSGRMIHASGSRGVMESGLDEAYYQRNWHSGGRVLQPTAVSPEPQQARPDRNAPALPAVTALDSLELIIEQQIDSIYVSDPDIFD